MKQVLSATVRLAPDGSVTKGTPMRLLYLLAGARRDARYLMLGVETVLALSACLLLLRTLRRL